MVVAAFLGGGDGGMGRLLSGIRDVGGERATALFDWGFFSCGRLGADVKRVSGT